MFNWFRRQSSDKSKEKAEVKPDQKVQEQPETEAEPATPPAEDYLSWAKAAYKNIQQQQSQEETATPSEELVTEAEVAETPPLEPPSVTETTEDEEVPSVTETTEDVAETTLELEAPPTVTEAKTETTPELEELVTDEKEIIPELESSPIVTESEEPKSIITAEVPTFTETTEAATPIPFWAREDRQERLERLKATAIVEEPETVTTTAQTEVLEEIPGVAFDDGFLWSAEVLAAQGRRPDQVSLEEISWLKRLRQGLDKTRRSLINQLKAIVGQGPLNQDAVMEIEALLLQADVGVEATDYIVSRLQQKLREEVLPPEQAIAYLKTILREMLDRPFQDAYSPMFVPDKDKLTIWLMTGVNGAGKTTTIGKIAHLAQKSGYSCLIGAADTFRAAAVEQVKIWGKRSGTEVIANPGQNTDPAAVVFDAIAAAQSRQIELLLVDTAGRLQNKKNLMDELGKIRRIVDKKAPDSKVEALLVLDATLGQNGLRQAQVFSEAAKLSGVVLTKLDGSAKGGIAIAVVHELGLPIRFIGAGEGIEDLRPFSSYEFVEALLSG